MADDVHDPTLDEIRRTKQDLARRLAEVEDIEREHLGDSGATASWLDFAAVLEARRSVKERYSTGFPGLDAKLEGGLYPGTMTVVQGKPGIGKTMLATQIALALGARCAVAVLYADEGMPGAAIRIGQQLGVPRNEMMTGDGHAAAFKALNTACPFWRFLDPSRAEATIEFMFEEFCKMAPPGLQTVFLLDSAQVIRSVVSTAGKLDRRQAMSAMLVRVHELALKHSAIVLLVSQVARGSYRSKNEGEQSDPLAAGLETSMIEFMAEVILHLDGKPTPDAPAVTLRCAKNRLSAFGTFGLPMVMEYPRARFLEADPAAAEAEMAIARDDENRVVLKDIVEILLSDYVDDGASSNELVRDLQPRRRADVLAAVRFGVGSGQLRREKRTGRGGGWSHFVKV